MIKGNNKTKKVNRIHHGRNMYLTFIITVIVVTVLMLLEFLIQNYSNRSKSKQTERVLYNQVESIVEKNDNEEIILIESLKEDYIVRAKAVAYVLLDNPNAKMNYSRLVRLSNLMKVDEINIFDNQGVIISSTNEKYVGLSMDSGAQISFFKPMLSDKNLYLCQDVTPNTAESKSMMYAMVWMENGDALVQVGIEPHRLLEEMNNNSLEEAVARMPLYAGMEVIVLSHEDGTILGATDNAMEGRKLADIGLEVYHNKDDGVRFSTGIVDGELSYITAGHHSNIDIVILQSVTNANQGIGITMGVVFLYLLLASSICIAIIHRLGLKLKEEQASRLKEKQEALDNIIEQFNITDALSKDFTDILIIDLEQDSSCMIKVSGQMLDYEKVQKNEWRPYYETWKAYADKYVVPEDKNRLMKSIGREVVINELSDKDDYSINYRTIYDDSMVNFQIKFIRVQGSGKDTYVAAVRNIEEVLLEQRRIDQLEKEANRDKLTGFYNRRAYDNDIAEIASKELDRRLVYIAMDVNGLKNVNDTLGHDAGDEIIKGAAYCMRRSMKAYGRIYRTGGDEFVAILKTGESELEKIRSNFENLVLNWHGKLNKNLSVSSGYICVRDNPMAGINEISKLADKEMYAAKALFYAERGIDRRGQQTAYDVVCNSYSRILKVNLTTDAYYVVQTDDKDVILDNPQNCFSEWIRNLVTSGRIHIGDVDEFLRRTGMDYLRKYFKRGNLAYEIQYRRKENDKFRKVMMEIIPAPEYDDSNQVVFLLIKDIANQATEEKEGNEYSKIIHRETAEQLIHEGIRNEYFYMMYQPQYYLSDHELRGFEALIRLRLPDGKIINPDVFIPDAESSNLITKIDEYVLEHAMREFLPLAVCKTPAKLEINVSAKTMEMENFPQKLKGYMDKVGFPPQMLGLEITEYSFAEEMESTISNIKAIEEMGVGISLDDFGTGYTSMEKLLELPAMLLKIDKSLIDNIENNDKKRDFVKAVVEMGHMMDCEVLAEGVEKEEQVEILKDFGCDCLQGYVWGRPMEFENIS